MPGFVLDMFRLRQIRRFHIFGIIWVSVAGAQAGVLATSSFKNRTKLTSGVAARRATIFGSFEQCISMIYQHHCFLCTSSFLKNACAEAREREREREERRGERGEKKEKRKKGGEKIGPLAGCSCVRSTRHGVDRESKPSIAS